MSTPALSTGLSIGSSDNPFTRAFRRGNCARVPSCFTILNSFLPKYHSNQPWVRTQCQLDKIYWAQLHGGSQDNLECRRALNDGAASFLVIAAVDLLEHTQRLHSDMLCQSTATHVQATTEFFLH
jgi:hypothetical protein